MSRKLEALPLICKISSRVIRILGCNPGFMTLQGTNTYLIGTGARRVLIDAGSPSTADKYTAALAGVLKQEQATIEHLIVTHWHQDHMGGVNAVQQLLQEISGPAKVWKLPRSKEDPNISEFEELVLWEPLKDQQVFEVEGAKLTVKHTPGHTTDHACLVLEDDDSLFSGDCILGHGTAVFEDLYTYMQSLRKILDMKPETIYPGHGPVVSSPKEKIQSYIDQRNAREREIFDLLRKRGPGGSMTEEEIVSIIYKDIAKELEHPATLTTLHHLNKLMKEGKVIGEPGSWKYIGSKY